MHYALVQLCSDASMQLCMSHGKFAFHSPVPLPVLEGQWHHEDSVVARQTFVCTTTITTLLMTPTAFPLTDVGFGIWGFSAVGVCTLSGHL